MLHITLYIAILSWVAMQTSAVNTFSPAVQEVYSGDQVIFICRWDTALGLLGPQLWEYKYEDNSTFFAILTTDSYGFVLIQDQAYLGFDVLKIPQAHISHHNLSIRCALSNQSPSTYTTTLYIYQPPSLAAPSNTLQYTVDADNPVLLSVIVGGYPIPSESSYFKWYHNDIEIVTSSYYSLTFQSLQIITTQPSDAGNYTLWVQTSTGNDSISFTLTVRYSPIINSSTHNLIGGAVGGSLTIECADGISGYPPPELSWYKISDNSVIEVLDINTSYLHFTSLTYNDSGVFICNVSNPLGFIVTNNTLTVYGAPSKPIIRYNEITATSFLLSWNAPVQTYGLAVDTYDISVRNTAQSEEIHITLSGHLTSYNVTADSTIKIYPDTEYQITIRAYTLNNSLSSPYSDPITINTLISSPILSQPTAYIDDTLPQAVLIIEWVLYSSGKKNTSISNYFVEFREINNANDNWILLGYFNVTRAHLSEFKSNSFYQFRIQAIRDQVIGEFIYSSPIYTQGFGVPPYPKNIWSISYEDFSNIYLNFFNIGEYNYTNFCIAIICLSINNSNNNNNNSNNNNYYTVGTHCLQGFSGGIVPVLMDNTQPALNYSCEVNLTNYYGIQLAYFNFISKLNILTQSVTSTTTTTMKSLSSSSSSSSSASLSSSSSSSSKSVTQMVTSTNITTKAGIITNVTTIITPTELIQSDDYSIVIIIIIIVIVMTIIIIITIITCLIVALFIYSTSKSYTLKHKSAVYYEMKGSLPINNNNNNVATTTTTTDNNNNVATTTTTTTTTTTNNNNIVATATNNDTTNATYNDNSNGNNTDNDISYETFEAIEGNWTYPQEFSSPSSGNKFTKQYTKIIGVPLESQM